MRCFETLRMKIKEEVEAPEPLVPPEPRVQQERLDLPVPQEVLAPALQVRQEQVERRDQPG